jgi:hypothetical protein
MAIPMTARNILEMALLGEGWGYFGHPCRRPESWLASDDPYQMARALDEAVAREATRLAWAKETLFAWGNSKAGRWCGDEMMGGSLANAAQLIARSMQAWDKAGP